MSTAGGAALGAGLGALTGLFGAVGAAKKGAAAGAAAVGWAAKGRAKKEAQQIQNSVGGKGGKSTFSNYPKHFLSLNSDASSSNAGPPFKRRLVDVGASVFSAYQPQLVEKVEKRSDLGQVAKDAAERMFSGLAKMPLLDDGGEGEEEEDRLGKHLCKCLVEGRSTGRYTYISKIFLIPNT